MDFSRLEWLQERVIELKEAVRYARDQRGHDGCWFDYHKVYRLLPNVDLQELSRMPEFEEGMSKCKYFSKNRRAEPPDTGSASAILDKTEWDRDLEAMRRDDLFIQLRNLENAAFKHYMTPEKDRTIEDDLELYSALPERVCIDATLPKEEEFLHSTKEREGCEHFMRSHQDCPVGTYDHNVHNFGPCRKIAV